MRMPPLPPHFLRRALPVFLLFLGATLALWIGLVLRRERAIPAAVPLASDSLLTVTICSVGNGEAAFIRTPGGKFIVIGCGPPGSEGVLITGLRRARAKNIALLALPYPYAEAIGGASGLVRAFPITLAVEGTSATAPPVNQWHAAARALCREKKIPIQTVWAGKTYTIDGVRIEVLAPAKIPLAVDSAGANNSLALRVTWRDTAFLFAGGLLRAGEDALLSRHPPIQSDFLRVARMGDNTATSPELLKMIGPRFIVVSAAGTIDSDGGDTNSSANTLKRLSATGAPIWQTGQAAQNLVFQSDGSRVWPGPDMPSGEFLVQ